MGSVECSVQVFPFFLHNHKSYLSLSVCLIGLNLSRSCQGGACNVLPVLFDYRRCKRNPYVLGSNPRTSTRAPANKLMSENADNRCSCESGCRSHASLTFWSAVCCPDWSTCLSFLGSHVYYCVIFLRGVYIVCLLL